MQPKALHKEALIPRVGNINLDNMVSTVCKFCAFIGIQLSY